MLDFANSITNSVCFSLFSNVTAEDLNNETTKRYYDIAQIFMVLVSWSRFMSFFLVIQSISILLMTLIKMITDAMTFLFITMCYLIMMTPIFTLLFQEESIVYID